MRERRETVLLVLREEARVQHHGRAEHGDEHERHEVLRLRAGDEQDTRRDHEQHEGGPEVGLQHDENNGRPAIESRTNNRRRSIVAIELRGHVGHRQDQSELGELGRLELEGPELEPRLRPVALRPER